MDVIGAFTTVVKNAAIQIITSKSQLLGVIDAFYSNKNLLEEVNKLYWMETNENFFDTEKFAGNGNIGHMLLQADYILED